MSQVATFLLHSTVPGDWTEVSDICRHKNRENITYIILSKTKKRNIHHTVRNITYIIQSKTIYNTSITNYTITTSIIYETQKLGYSLAQIFSLTRHSLQARGKWDWEGHREQKLMIGKPSTLTSEDRSLRAITMKNNYNCQQSISGYILFIAITAVPSSRAVIREVKLGAVERD